MFVLSRPGFKFIAPTINGQVRGGPDLDFEVAFGDILKNLSFGMMGELCSNRGRSGLVLV
jgi:hypothetical protein